MADIVLCTLNARYAHAAFGLRYLFANLGELRARAEILEFEASRAPVEIVGAILARGPRIVGLGVYIWNAAPMADVVATLKRVRPDITIILGGPEVSHETGESAAAALADFVVRGEADLAFRDLCAALLEGRAGGIPRWIDAPPPSFAVLALPYAFYTDEDVAQRVLYVEASRGCPFECEFCLSALDDGVRPVPLDGFLEAMQALLDRGARTFKFVDRTFNLSPRTAGAILDFFLVRLVPDLFLHFEMIPDRLPDELKQRIRRFPAGALQFEVGIQSFNVEVNERIKRRQDNDKAVSNLSWLRAETGVHLHTDLIVGLPGEDLASFGRSFDLLSSLRPHEIQIGILKRLRGTPIDRHAAEFSMVYAPMPPYEVLKTSVLPFEDVQRMKHFARFFDLVSNSGRFQESGAWFRLPGSSAFATFLAFSDWLHARTHAAFGIPLDRLAHHLYDWLTVERRHDPAEVGPMLWRDYSRGGRSDRPEFLRPWISGDAQETTALKKTHPGRERQQRGSAGVIA